MSLDKNDNKRFGLIGNMLDMLSYDRIWNIAPEYYEDLKKNNPKAYSTLPDPLPYYYFYSKNICESILLKYLSIAHGAALLVFSLVYRSEWSLHQFVFLHFLMYVDIAVLVLMLLVAFVSLYINLEDIKSKRPPKTSNTIIGAIFITLIAAPVFLVGVDGTFPATHGPVTIMSFLLSVGAMLVGVTGLSIAMILATGYIAHIYIQPKAT